MPKRKTTTTRPPLFPNTSAVVQWQRRDLELRVYNTPAKAADFPAHDDANALALFDYLRETLPDLDPAALLRGPVSYTRNGMHFTYYLTGFEPDSPCIGNEPDLFKRAAWQALLDAGLTAAK